MDRAGGSRIGLEPKPLRGSLSPRGQRMEVMIAQQAVVGGGPGRERGEIPGLLGDAPVQGASGADLALGWEGLGGWKGPRVGAVGLAQLGGGPLCAWSSWCIEAPPAWGGVLTILGLSLFSSGGLPHLGLAPEGQAGPPSWISGAGPPSQTPLRPPSQPPRVLLAPARPLPPRPLQLHPLAHAPFSRQPAQISPGPLSLRASPRHLCLLSRVTWERVCVYPSVGQCSPCLPRVGSCLAVWVYWVGVWSQPGLSEARLFLAALGGGSAEGPAQRHPPSLLRCPLGLRKELSFSGVIGRRALCYRHSGFTESPEL